MIEEEEVSEEFALGMEGEEGAFIHTAVPRLLRVLPFFVLHMVEGEGASLPNATALAVE